MNRVIGRKNGVTIDEEFYKVLENEAFLTSSHLLFFENVFFKYFYYRKKVRELIFRYLLQIVTFFGNLCQV